MKQFCFLFLFLASFSFGQVIITELADPNGNTAARYVEIHNLGSSAVDLTGWALIRWTNGNSTQSTNEVDLSSIGDLVSGGFAIIANNSSTFQLVYGVEADINAGTSGPADSNGDDQIAIVNASNAVIDIFGVPGEDGSGTCHEFEDGRAERKASTVAANSTWDESEWNVWADSAVSGCTTHVNSPQVAPGDFDPGEWIGTISAPTIILESNITSLDYFSEFGPSTEQSFSISAINLTANLSVTAPTNFEISLTSGSGFGNSLVLTPISGAVNLTTIYVRLAAGLAIGTYDGNITTSSTGAVNQAISITGEVFPANPQITVNTFTLDSFDYIGSQGGPSNEDSFTVEGLFLSGDITVAAPINYEVSLTSGSSFENFVTISPNSGSVSTTTVYIRLSAGLSVDTYSGNVSVESTEVTTETFSVSGNVFGPPEDSMVITGIYDGPLVGGTPKGIELFVLKDIANLSFFGISSVSNGNGSSMGNIEFNFPTGTASAGDRIFIATESTQFNNFFGTNPTYTTEVVSINGDDSIELYENRVIIDTFGDVDVDGSGEGWDYLDGWAYRNNNTGPDGVDFMIGNWTFSGINALDGETSNSNATDPYPISTYTVSNLGLIENRLNKVFVYPNPSTLGYVIIETESTEDISIEVFNLAGKLLKTEILNDNKLDVKSLESGVYMLRINQDGGITTQKLIVR